MESMMSTISIDSQFTTLSPNFEVFSAESLWALLSYQWWIQVMANMPMKF